ncbi:MAG: S8 family serine peptidase [Loktanella sp.]|nr:S8 family serine peptidase [Loktanella sp.]
MKKAAGFILILLLAACKSNNEVDAVSIIEVMRAPGDSFQTDPITVSETTDENPFPWNRFFVTEFDRAKVQSVRALAGYLANDFRFRLLINGHPTYGENGKHVESHPLTAARLDYALSTGLTGAGQIVSMIDSGIRLSHEQFDGKTIYTSGNVPPPGDFHGTAVASVIAGSGTNGGTLGFAAAADIHQGYLDYDASVSWSKLGAYMSDAAGLGAIASNNSWGLAGMTVKNADVATYFNSRQTKPYIDGLRNFATGGVIVFALQNDYRAESASLIAALPLGIPELEANWISVVNAIPVFDDERILSAERISTACLETARFCMAANGQIMVASETGNSDYEVGIGASFAAPQVAGSIALLAEAFPDLSAAQLRDRLLATADNRFFDNYAGVVTFAPGITHGYNQEFGHGFLDLRSALLPIGQPVVMMANGQTIDLGTAAITSGAATGDGLTQSLAALSVVSQDQLNAGFTLSAEVLAGADSPADHAATALLAAIHPTVAAARRSQNAAIRSGKNLAGHRGVWSDPTGAELLGSNAIPLTSPDNDFGFSVLTGEGTTGVSVHQTFDVVNGNLRLGFASMRTDGSIMGVSVASSTGEVSSSTNAVHVDFASRIATDTALRFNAEMGVASGDGAGMVNDFSSMSYNRVSVTLERADVGRTGDVLAMFARRPVGIIRGSATMDLPVQFANGVTSFASQNVSLAPVERQFDVGFEYSTPVLRNANLTVGMMHSDNNGNTAGRRVVSSFIGLHFSF